MEQQGPWQHLEPLNLIYFFLCTLYNKFRYYRKISSGVDSYFGKLTGEVVRKRDHVLV